jgi:fructose-1-phosphate kinase PfkB-like protein
MKVSPHIYTLTGNLLAERTLEFTDWSPGRTQRAGRDTFHARGKGVNVSNMLTRLGVPNTALIFAGGCTGAECEAWLRHRGIVHRVFASKASTRSGTVIWSQAQPETTFLGPDCAPDEAALHTCAKYLDCLPDGQVLALCGSFPGWNDVSFDPLRASLLRWLQRGLLVADAYGPPLQWLARLPLTLIKINRTEFEAYSPPLPDGDSLSEHLRQVCVTGPVQAWILTDGAGPIWLAAKTGELQEFQPPSLREVSPTGSGDVFFACLLQSHFHSAQSWPESIVHGMPYAAANAAHPGVADFEWPPSD